MAAAEAMGTDSPHWRSAGDDIDDDDDHDDLHHNDIVTKQLWLPGHHVEANPQ